MRYFIFIFLSSLSLFAHPHFFVDASIDIQKDKISHQWQFDKINSKLLIFESDKNKNKKLEKDEQLSFLKNHIEKLKVDNYNLFMELDSQEIVANPVNMQVKIINRRLVLSFDLLYKVDKEGTICTIDPTLYYAYKLKDIKSAFKYEKQISEHDYCIGVSG